MVNNIGVTQGRLTNPLNRTDIQFPLYNNEEIVNEFEKTKKIGLDYIEWVVCKEVPNWFLGEFYDQQVLKSLQEHFVPINSICLDYLMDLDLIDKDQIFAVDSINWISNIASNVGCKLLVIPIYEKNMDIASIIYLTDKVLEGFNLNIAFEFLDVNCYTGINFINDLNYGNKVNKKIGCCFDIGNNYERNIIEELKNYNVHGMLKHIHIKEKNTRGESTELGKGTIGKSGWRKIFNCLKTINYEGFFTLQVARGKDGDEVATVEKQMDFIKEIL